MESLTLKCPLCCEETFSSHQSLKYHILSLTENLFCPSCDKRFYNLCDLTDHLGRECKEIPEDISNQISSRDVSSTNPKKYLQNEINSSPGDANLPKTEIKNEEETYFCHMCNINILSVEDHLSEYHQGEDIIMVGMS